MVTRTARQIQSVGIHQTFICSMKKKKLWKMKNITTGPDVPAEAGQRDAAQVRDVHVPGHQRHSVTVSISTTVRPAHCGEVRCRIGTREDQSRRHLEASCKC